MRCHFPCKYLCSFLFFFISCFRHHCRCRPRLRLNSHVSNTNPTNAHTIPIYYLFTRRRKKNLFSARIVVEYYAVFIFKYYSLVCETISLLLVMSFFQLLGSSGASSSIRFQSESAASQSIRGRRSVFDVPQGFIERRQRRRSSNKWAENILCVKPQTMP